MANLLKRSERDEARKCCIDRTIDKWIVNRLYRGRRNERGTGKNRRNNNQTRSSSKPFEIWNDVSTSEGFNNYEIEPTLEAWIVYHAQDINKTTDVDEYYLRADRLTKEMLYFRVQGEDLQKDFENLNVLQILMGHLDYVISVEKQQGLDTAESYGELTKCFTYFTELFTIST